MILREQAGELATDRQSFSACDAFFADTPLTADTLTVQEQTYLVTYCPEGSPNPQNGPFPVPYGVYFMTEDGRRELLAYYPAVHCNQAVPLVTRPVPPPRPSQVDYTQTMGRYYVQDVHHGQGVAGVPRGTVKTLRVVALEYRAADAYYNSNVGEAGRSHSRTPPAINNGSWDVKHVLGTVPVEADGSAYFEVPARTPVYFQLLDERGYAVQTMRSWSTLQPGETQTCVGCHESKHEAPPPMPSAAAICCCAWATKPARIGNDSTEVNVRHASPPRTARPAARGAGAALSPPLA